MKFLERLRTFILHQLVSPFLFHPRPDRFDGVEVAAYRRHEQRNSFVLLDVTDDFVTAMRRVVVHYKDFIF